MTKGLVWSTTITIVMPHGTHKRDSFQHLTSQGTPNLNTSKCLVWYTSLFCKKKLVLNVQLLWSTLISKGGWLELVWSALIEINGIVMAHYIFGLITLHGNRWLGKSKKLSGKEIEIGKPLIDSLAIKVIERFQIKRYNLNYTQLCLWWTGRCFDKTRFLPKGQPL